MTKLEKSYQTMPETAVAGGSALAEASSAAAAASLRRDIACTADNQNQTEHFLLILLQSPSARVMSVATPKWDKISLQTANIHEGKYIYMEDLLMMESHGQARQTPSWPLSSTPICIDNWRQVPTLTSRPTFCILHS